MKSTHKFMKILSCLVFFFSNNAISSEDYFSVVTYEIQDITLETGKKVPVTGDYPILSNYKQHLPIISASFNVIETPIVNRRQMNASQISKKNHLTSISHNKWGVILKKDDLIEKKNQDYLAQIIHSINMEDQKKKLKFHSINYDGWNISIDQELYNDYMLKTKVLSAIKMQLYKISYKLNAKAVKKLKTVPILLHMSKVYDSEYAIAYYDSKYRSVIFHDANKLIELGNLKNAVVLHELAHGFHDINLGFEYQPIIDAYDNAVKTGLYQNVRSVYDDELTDKAYALTNHVEYFAELTESYFASPAEKFGNDYFPFNRYELKTYDRMGYNLLKQIWGL